MPVTISILIAFVIQPLPRKRTVIRNPYSAFLHLSLTQDQLNIHISTTSLQFPGHIAGLVIYSMILVVVT